MVPTCLCPIDRYGDDCAQIRDYRCSIRVKSPDLSCSSFYIPVNDTKRSDEDFACPRYSLKDEKITLDFSISCKQLAPLPETWPNMSSFTYFLKSDDVTREIGPIVNSFV
jgi:hypothetical protein